MSEDLEVQAGLTPDGLADAIVAQLETPVYFKTVYTLGIVVAMIEGETPLVGKYIDENVYLVLNLEDATAQLTCPDGSVAEFTVDRGAFAVAIQDYRNKLHKGLNPDELVQALFSKLGPKDRYWGVYAAAVETAAIFGEASLFGRTAEDQFGLVISETYENAAVYKGDELVASFELDYSTFSPLRDVFYSED